MTKITPPTEDELRELMLADRDKDKNVLMHPAPFPTKRAAPRHPMLYKIKEAVALGLSRVEIGEYVGMDYSELARIACQAGLKLPRHRREWVTHHKPKGDPDAP